MSRLRTGIANRDKISRDQQDPAACWGWLDPGAVLPAGCHIPFPRSQLGRPHALLGASDDVSDAKSSQGILLLPLISQGRGAEVQDEEEAVQQTPSPEQLEVLIMLSCQKTWGSREKKAPKRQNTVNPNAEVHSTKRVKKLLRWKSYLPPCTA